MNLWSGLVVFYIWAAVSYAGDVDDVIGDIQKENITDLCFLVDITGSMQPYINCVRNTILDIVSKIETDKVEQLRLAFVGYRDNDDSPEFEILPFTESPNDFRSFVAKLKATGGGDTPENVFGGLEKVGNLKWNRQAGTRVMIHIADAPCHGKRYNNGHDRNSGNEAQLADKLEVLLGNLREHNIDYNFGKVSSQTDKMITEFSKVYGEKIPQFTVKACGTNTPPRPTCCSKPRHPCCARRGRVPVRLHEIFRPSRNVTGLVKTLSGGRPRTRSGVRSLARRERSAPAREDLSGRPIITPTIPRPDMCMFWKGACCDYRSCARPTARRRGGFIGSSGPSGGKEEESFVTGALAAYRRGRERAKARLGDES